MVSSDEDAKALLHKWEQEGTSLLFGFSVPARISLRLQGRISRVFWPKLRVKNDFANFEVDLSGASFEYKESREAEGEFAEVLKERFVALLSARFRDNTECFFGERTS
jgi:hypothetical protein